MTFPKDYQKEELRGKKAELRRHRSSISTRPNAGELDDDFAKRLGLENLDALRAAVKDQMDSRSRSR